MAKRTGFTLAELLITLMIGGVILALAAQVITSHIRTTSRQEVLQRLRDHWGRINHLINTEALEGSRLTTNENTLPDCTNGAGSALTIHIPGRVRAIHYFNTNDGSLWRCGPDILENGQLASDADAPVTSLVARDAELVAHPDANETENHEMVYTLTLTARSNGQDVPYEASSRAQTTARTY